MKSGKLVLLRHGQSEWNKRDLFTGWVDVPLSPLGIEEALQAGKKIAHIPFDVIFTSKLIRAEMTAFLAMSVHRGGKIPYRIDALSREHSSWNAIHSKETLESCIPVISAMELNERMYGALQGLNKQETRKKFGESQVLLWRRSYDIAPPEGESLELNVKRTVPYFEKQIQPRLQKGESILLVAHGNSLRSIVMYIEGLSKEAIVKLEIPTGDPFAYTYEDGVFHRSLVDE